MKARIVHRESCTMKQNAKVTVKVGDWVKSTDHRSEFYRRVGRVIEITEWIDPGGSGRGPVVKVKFFGPGSAWSGKGGTESTGTQWFEYFGPSEEEGYHWRGPWRATRRDGGKAEERDSGTCWQCGTKAIWLQRHGTGHTTFACSKHAEVIPATHAVTIECRGPAAGNNWYVKGAGFETGPYSAEEAIGRMTVAIAIEKDHEPQ